jgi:two-component system heavy metal sensor histidine kinase CusS
MSSRNGPEPAASRRRPWSLAARLTAWYACGAAVLALAVGGFSYWALASGLDRQEDAALAARVLILRALLRERPEDSAALRQEVEEGEWAEPHGRAWVRVLDDGGGLVMETPGMAGVLPAGEFPSPGGPDEPPGKGADLRAGGGGFRVLSARASAGRAGGRVLQVAVDRSQADELLADFRRSLLFILGVALLASAAGGYHLARRGIRPVREIADAARRVRAATLDQRLDASGLPAELAALAGTFNEMLDRLEESFARVSRFSPDAAHELRTPVNNLRGEAEVTLSRPRSAEEYREAIGSCLEECVRLAKLIDSLLFLARAEDPRTQVPREPLDVGAELAAVREFYEAAASEAGVSLSVDAPAGLSAELSRPLLQRALGNLVENALAYTPPGGSVRMSAARESGGGVRVEVADTGCGVAEADLPHLLDRFYRADPARTAATGGVGLGLAIVKGIAELHGGAVEIDSRVGRGTRVALHFPAAGGRR